MPDSTIPTHRYEIEPRASHLGGGWRLRCFEGDEEVAGGVFPLDPELGHDDADKEAYGDAMEEGEAWLASTQPESRTWIGSGEDA